VIFLLKKASGAFKAIDTCFKIGCKSKGRRSNINFATLQKNKKYCSGLVKSLWRLVDQQLLISLHGKRGQKNAFKTLACEENG